MSSIFMILCYSINCMPIPNAQVLLHQLFDQKNDKSNKIKD
jgi:hypothetical protein